MAETQTHPGTQTHTDPLSGEPGAHPVGTGVGAAVGGAAAGAALGAAGAVVTGGAIGSVAGPLGAVVGALAGGLAGGALGHRVAESIDPTVLEAVDIEEEALPAADEQFWHERYLQLPSVLANRTFADYLPAFRCGRQCREEFVERPFSEIEPELRQRWMTVRGESPLDWEDARYAVRDGYETPVPAPPPEALSETPPMNDPWLMPPL